MKEDEVQEEVDADRSGWELDADGEDAHEKELEVDAPVEKR